VRRAYFTAWVEAMLYQKSFFGAVDAKRRVPRNNVLFVGVLALAGAFLLPAPGWSYHRL